ncbi:hypothetical protein BS17DRAFT_789952 [Gyrodon lividus]|nr:hypothetical protein BS17DRAFT_789952 [Gyrodon lividus]
MEQDNTDRKSPPELPIPLERTESDATYVTAPSSPQNLSVLGDNELVPPPLSEISPQLEQLYIPQSQPSGGCIPSEVAGTPESMYFTAHSATQNIHVWGDTPSLADRCPVITKMKATDLSASLRRLPAGFYVSMMIENKEYRTANKPASMEKGMTEWLDHIYLPSDQSSMIEVRIYASFELGPMLGRGELLREFSIGVGDLVEHSNTSSPIYFLPKEREVVSSCSSLEVTVQLLLPQDMNKMMLCSPVAAKCDEVRAVAQATDVGHTHMLCYYKDADESHIDGAIAQFQSVLDGFPLNHPARGAASDEGEIF